MTKGASEEEVVAEFRRALREHSELQGINWEDPAVVALASSLEEQLRQQYRQSQAALAMFKSFLEPP